MFLALFIRPSPQFEEPELPNQELFEPVGSHDDEPDELIDGNQLDEDCEGYQFDEPDGNQLEEEDDQWEDDENIADPSTTPTPTPMPKTANTVEIG